MIIINSDFVKDKLPIRLPETNKNNYGRILAICGSLGYTGAAYFASEAAVRTGSGVVTLAVPEKIYPILAMKLNEPVIRPITCDNEGRFCFESFESLIELANHSDAVLIGCGLGCSEKLTELVIKLITNINCPIVLDADGINAICSHTNILRSVKADIILTPHYGEFKRLIGNQEVSPYSAEQFAVKNACTLLLKSHRTKIFTPDKLVYQNTTGNAGMAKGGSGDILSGIILSLLGQGLSHFDAAACGTWLHGKTGDICAQKFGEYGMTPTDMLYNLPYTLLRTLGK